MVTQRLIEAIDEATARKWQVERLLELPVLKDVNWRIESHFRDAANSLQLGILGLEVEKKNTNG
jgi:hypothetical protein